MKGICPVCDELAPLKPTGIAQGRPGSFTSSMWNEVLSHPDERTKRVNGAGVEVVDECRGTGRRV